MDYKDHEEHRDWIVEAFAAEFKKKYDAGALEHGGKLWMKSCHRELGAEIIDFVAYYFSDVVHRAFAIRTMRQGLRSASEDELRRCVRSALSVLEHGNDLRRDE